MLDGAFHADVVSMPGDRGIALSWEGVIAIVGAKAPVHGEESDARLPDPAGRRGAGRGRGR